MRTALCLLFLLPLSSSAQTRLTPDDVPVFQVRARVTAVGTGDIEKKKFTFTLPALKTRAQTTGPAWSEWLRFERDQIEANLKTYPATYMRGWPVVTHLSVGGVIDPTKVEVELMFPGDERIISCQGELYGPSLGLVIWRDEQKRPQAATMGEYNRRYWQHLARVSIPADERPKHFPIVDRFIGGDNDRIAWREGIETLGKAGFSAQMLPANGLVRSLLLATGLRRTAWAVYNPPGYAFDHDPQVTPEAIQAWAQAQVKPYRSAGFDVKDMALFAMSDEPGWYYPQAFKALRANPKAMDRFRTYLKERGLQPADVGVREWSDVQPLGRSGAKDLPGKRLFYWTMRFFAWDSARHFAVCTKALEEAFYPGMPIFTNWNFFAGRLYVPGPVANNNAKMDPDAAMGGHDWFEFGRLRGGTMLWTEDWFRDSQAYQWSFYAAKLRSAARLGNVEFGGYVIPRTAGDREDGILQKILTIVGHGGKGIKYFVFGPEYNFPGNCYSENARVLPKMAEAHRLIGKSESVLWPGRPKRAEVAIVMPRSALLWDAKEMPIAKGISDATNTNLNAATVDYMAEVFNLYLALQHANIPCDFLDEDDLTQAGLAPYRVVYLTAPNLPVEGQTALREWTAGGRTLVAVSNAATRDRYDEPIRPLWDAVPMRPVEPRERLLIADAKRLPQVGTIRTADGEVAAFGTAPKGSALEVQKLGSGQVYSWSCLPGLSYFRSATATRDKLPSGFHAGLREMIVAPIREAKLVPPTTVSVPLVEAPLLLSDAGAAVTLLNWTGESIPQLEVIVRVPFTPKSVTSAQRGALTLESVPGGVRVRLPLDAADILSVQ